MCEIKIFRSSQFSHWTFFRVNSLNESRIYVDIKSLLTFFYSLIYKYLTMMIILGNLKFRWQKIDIQKLGIRSIIEQSRITTELKMLDIQTNGNKLKSTTTSSSPRSRCSPHFIFSHYSAHIQRAYNVACAIFWFGFSFPYFARSSLKVYTTLLLKRCEYKLTT